MIFIEELAYSFHIGSDKNKKNISRANGKNNISGTTSLSNNAIQNAKTLSKVDKHNYRKYDDKQDEIVIIKGTTSLYDDVKNLYKTEFDEARLEYNSKQKRDDRKIDDYFTNISNNIKNDLACEIIIELGDKKYWDTKDINYKKKMTNVFIEQVKDLELLVPNFKIASAIIHYDETSPHLHIVGVPIKYKNKNGMSKQVCKSDVFTKSTLVNLQDKMRTLCIDSFNKEYKTFSKLTEKKKGRNLDYNVSEMTNYQKVKDEISKNQKDLDIINQKSLELDNDTTDIKNIINNLKGNITTGKNNVILNQNDKEKIINYIDKVDNTNKEYKKINELSLTLKNVDIELKNNKILVEENNALKVKNTALASELESKNDEINDLKEKNFSLKYELTIWKNKFMKIINFIKNRLTRWQDKEKYQEFTNDLLHHGAIDYDTYEDIINTKNVKEKDDFER